jgi:hypothetical protein
MKHFFTFLLAVLLTSTTFAQVGINTETPDPSSALDITSTAGGLLPPRMTSDQRDNIVSPVEGLIIFCTDCGSEEGELQIKLSSQWVNLYNPGSGGGNTYVARAEFDATQNLANIHFADFSGTGAHLISGTGTSISGQFGNFTFANEVAPPKSVFAYAANTSTNEYILTHLNAGGDNAVYKIKGFTMTAYTSASGLANQFDAAIFSDFGAASIDIDLQKGNFDWNRVGFPSAKEAHVYLVFTF